MALFHTLDRKCRQVMESINRWWCYGFHQRSFTESSEALTRWYHTVQGEKLYKAEQALAARMTAHCFGYHAMQLSACESGLNVDKLRIAHRFRLHPKKMIEASGVSSFEKLPFSDDMLDLVILHHALDASNLPHSVLRESARCIIPRGYVLIIGFDPLSFFGFYSLVAKLFSKNPLYRLPRIRRGRLLDWLKLVNLSATAVDCAGFTLFEYQQGTDTQLQYRDTQHSEKQPFGVWLMSLWRRAMCGSYVILTRKDYYSITPINKLKWAKHQPAGSFVLTRNALRRYPRQE